jgi:hypothetical protein
MDTILQLKINLRGTKPLIWRRILVEQMMTFDQLHHTIQLVMGWTNSHLHEFIVNGTRIGQSFDNLDADHGAELIDSSTVTLESILSPTDLRFIYLYDFGDSWEHELLIEKRLSRDEMTNYPDCVGGKLNCPPENCGGIPGFYELLATLADKRHPERKEMLAWLGGTYDTQTFNQEEVNQQLAALFH